MVVEEGAGEDQQEQQVVLEEGVGEDQQEQQVVLEEGVGEDQQEQQVVLEEGPGEEDQQSGSEQEQQTEEQESALPRTEEGGASDGGEWRTRAEQAEAQVKELEEQINVFRDAVISALEPLAPEVDRLMQTLSDEVAQIQTLVSQARQHLQVTAPPPEKLMGLSELQKLETSSTELQGRVDTVRTTLMTRLQEVLGEPEDAPAEQEQLVSG